MSWKEHSNALTNLVLARHGQLELEFARVRADGHVGRLGLAERPGVAELLLRQAVVHAHAAQQAPHRVVLGQGRRQLVCTFLIECL